MYISAHSLYNTLLNHRIKIQTIRHFFAQHSDYYVTSDDDIFLLACKHGYFDIVLWCIHNGVDSCYGIQIACKHTHIIKYLVSIGHNPRFKNNCAIIAACDIGNLSAVKFLYSIGCDPRDNNDWAIALASEGGHLKVVKFLYKIGCDITARDNATIRWSHGKPGYPALARAAVFGYINVVKFLMNHGCDADFAMEWACTCGFIQVVDTLCCSGYKPSMKHVRMAIDYGHPDIAFYLIKYGLGMFMRYILGMRHR